MEETFMTAVATPDAARLVFAAVAGLILLLILIIKFKVHAMISILIGAVGIGLMAGMPLSDIIGSVNEGIGNTLKGIALLVGLGSMFGAILEESGGAQTLAVTMVRKFGDEKAAWALGITGLVVAMPVFFDAGLIILIPLAFSLAKRTKRSVLYYVIPLLAGLAVGHAFIPPTPGPVLVASMLGVDLGWVILIGIFCGIFAMIAAGPIWGSICGKKYMIEVPEHVAQQADIDESKLPKFGTIVGDHHDPAAAHHRKLRGKGSARTGRHPARSGPSSASPSWRCCWLPSLLCTCWAPATATLTPSWKRS